MLKTSFRLCMNQRWSTSESGLRHLFLLARYGLLAALTIFLCLSTLSAQTVGKLAGTVLQAETGIPLPGVNIVIVGTGMGAAADENGFYYILNVPPGKYELRAIMIGFKTMKFIEVVVNGGRTTQIDFMLVDDILETDEVIVTAERPDVERDKTSTSTIVRFEDVQALPGVRDISDVLNLTSDVVDGHFRGGREGEQYYTLQGMGIVNPLDRSSAFLPIISQSM